MTKIEYLEGDATDPVEVDGMKVLLHICNDQGAWGAGFVLALSGRWSEPESVYRNLAKDGLCLGDIQIVQVRYNLIVVNMIAQTLGWTQGSDGKMIPPISYGALRECLRKVSWLVYGLKQADGDEGVSVVGPRFGAGLAGGDWKKIEAMIEQELKNVDVYIYDLPPKD